MNPIPSNLTLAPPAGLLLDALQTAAADRAKPDGAMRAWSPAKAAPDDSVTLEALASKNSKTSTSAATAKKTTTRKKTTTKAKAGYASATTLPKDLAFLRDPKLSIEEKLMRLAAFLTARSEARVQQKMEELGGGAAGKASGTGTKAPKPRPKQNGFWKTALDTTKVMFPAVGLSMELLKNPATKAALKTVGGPVLAAAATALGFPQAAPALLRFGPGAVDLAAGALQAVEKAASAESATEPGGSASGGSANGGASGTGSAKHEQLQLMELNQLMDKQKEMFSLLSNMLRSMHDTKSQIIGNLR